MPATVWWPGPEASQLWLEAHRAHRLGALSSADSVAEACRNRETVPLLRQIAIAKTERRSAAFRGCVALRVCISTVSAAHASLLIGLAAKTSNMLSASMPCLRAGRSSSWLTRTRTRWMQRCDGGPSLRFERCACQRRHFKDHPRLILRIVAMPWAKQKLWRVSI